MSVKGNHVYTSGAIGTNAAVIRGALRAEKPEKLTVVLPQSLRKQPQESQELLKQVIECHDPDIEKAKVRFSFALRCRTSLRCLGIMI